MSSLPPGLMPARNLTDIASASVARANLNQGVVALVYSATIASSAALGNMFSLTATGAFTLSNPTGMLAGATYMWSIRQDSSGGRLITWGTSFVFPAGARPTLSTAASAVDLLVGVYDGTSLMCNLNKSFA